MSVSIIRSERGKELIVFENFTFSKDVTLKSGEISWRCSQKRLNCKAKLYTVGPDNIITKKGNDHNHKADEKKIARKTVSSICKRKAVEDLSERPSKIICKTLASNLPPSLTTTDVSYIRKNIYNCRRKVLPGPFPKSKEDVHQILSTYAETGAETLLTNKGEKFLFVNDLENNIIILTCKTNIDILIRTNILYMDGTFTFCTKFFLSIFYDSWATKWSLCSASILFITK